jgi:hypothetical protein
MISAAEASMALQLLHHPSYQSTKHCAKRMQQSMRLSASNELSTAVHLHPLHLLPAHSAYLKPTPLALPCCVKV